MVSHEQEHIAKLTADSPEDKRVERLTDLGVVNVHDGYVAEFGDPDRPVMRDPKAIDSANQPKPHYSRRGGRAFPEVDEPGFREPTHHDSTPEDREANLEGLDVARELVRGLDVRRAALSGNPGETRRTLAIQRARDERRGR
jgi:hypothetical protein